MIPACLIVGDSIGVGMAGALAMQGIHCEVRAQVGATSKRVLDLQPVIAATGHAVIAAGSNDPANPGLKQNLRRLRTRLAAQRVTWIAPYDARASRIVVSLALTFGDTVVPLSLYATRDRVHPASYGPLSRSLAWPAPVPSAHVTPLNPAPPRPVRRAVVMAF